MYGEKMSHKKAKETLRKIMKEIRRMLYFIIYAKRVLRRVGRLRGYENSDKFFFPVAVINTSN
jgi:hypothetical protein